ncbi:WhiB family transcriptional regulator [Streptacidiphilus sp. P02-A3a]|uniref:WhiB family transcriptional regulator n=1 Tax=Streptacidiphilus sp. P02-A3a TaxID=2704468 RepID=UPI001CDD06EC|nr:WhiB family transcriptional regulator [Streptacidiphilus sp. P02-A3a]
MRRFPVAPVSELWEWQLTAACRGMDSEVFFSPSGERGSRRRRREAAARQVCRACPVRTPCAAFALATSEPHGLWGGLSETERLNAVGGSRG